MALSGTIYTNYYNSHIRLKLSWTGTQSVENNTTTIKWTLTSNGGSSGSWWMSGPVKVTIGSTTVLNKTDRFKMYGGGAYKKTGSVTVNHNADGTKSIGMTIRAAIYSSSVNCTGSGTFTLNTINRYALITNYEPFTDEGNPTITYTNPRGPELVTDLKVRITWNFNTEYTSWYDISDWSGGTYTINLSAEDRELLRAGTPNSNTLAVKFDLQSNMEGGSPVIQHDYKDSYMEIVNANPIMSNDFEFLSGEQYIEDITGSEYTIIQERSTINARSKLAQGVKGASIVSYSLNFAGENYTPEIRQDQYPVHVTIGHLDIAGGTYPATLTATDSRGNTAAKIIDVLVYGWTQPSALYSFERVQDFTTNSAILRVDGKISTIPGSTLIITESHREKGVGNWSTPATIQDETDETITGLDYQKEYELIITVSDSFTRADDPQTNTTYTVTIGKGIPIAFFDALRSSVAVNGVPDENNQLFVGGTIKAKPNTTDAGIVLPHVYSTTEQIVGYWTDGSPVYEKTIELSSLATIASGSSVAIPTSDWSQKAYPIDIVLYNKNGSSGSDLRQVWRWVTAQINITTGALTLHNGRAASMSFDTFTIQYIKIT